MKEAPRVNHLEENKRRRRAIDREDDFLTEEVLNDDGYTDDDLLDGETEKTNIEKPMDGDLPVKRY